MPIHISALDAGQFLIGGDIHVNRLGFGAMHVTGQGSWGPPEDRARARATLRKLSRLQVNFVDTADSYGPFVSEELIRHILRPYDNVLIATKGGLLRLGPDRWVPLGRPDYLRQCVLMSLRRLGIERIDLWQLHRIDPSVPRDEQFDAIASMRREGLIRHVGLSEVVVEDIEAAAKYFPVATVQNEYNFANRKSEQILDYCEARNIGFIPSSLLAAGSLATPSSVLRTIALRHRATSSQVALAWLLRRSHVMLPIPGTANVRHLTENVAAAGLQLSDEAFAALSAAG